MYPVLRTTALVAGLVMMACWGAGGEGCASPPEGFDSPNPGARLDAIADAAADQDRTAIKDLITSLDSDDPAVRMIAILTLERLTSETHGYDFAAPEWERGEAVERWAAWYRERHPEADTASVPPVLAP